MKKSITLLWLFSLYFLGITIAQQVEIEPESITKRKHFKTTVFLMDGGKISGKLNWVSDSNLLLAKREGTKEQGWSYEFLKVNYEDIRKVRLRHEALWINVVCAAVAIPVGYVAGAFIGYIVAIEHTSKAGMIVFGATFATFSLTGLIVPQLAKKRYFFEINGDLQTFLLHKESLKRMIVE